MEEASGLSENSVLNCDDNSVDTVLNGPYAITVRHAHIQYVDVMSAMLSGATPTTQVVLKDFNMSVKKGHM